MERYRRAWAWPPERAGRNTTPCFSETKSRDTCCSQPLTIACICAPAARPSCSAILRSGEAPMADAATKVTAKEMAKETAKQFKWVGTRPVRPDGVPKVTGRGQYGADLGMQGM